MLDIGSSELLMIVVIAVVVIGPKDLPRALYKLGQVIGKARAVSRHFRTGLDAMIREAEMEEMEKKWAAENRRIMEKYPSGPMESVTQADGPIEEGGKDIAPVSAPVPSPAHDAATDADASLPAPLAPPAEPQDPAPADGKAP